MRTVVTAHVCLWAAAAACGRQAGAFIHGGGGHTRHLDAGRSSPASRSPWSARQQQQQVRVIASRTTPTATCAGRRGTRPKRQHHHHHQPAWAARSSYSRLGALPAEDTDAESTATSSTEQAEGVPPGTQSGRKGTPGKDGPFISKLARRLADSFPLLTADEITNEVRMLLNPETKGEAGKAAHAREDNLAILAKDVRELVEELMEQVGSSAESNAGLVELKDVAQKFKGVLLKGDPAAAEQLRRQVLDDLEEVREEIEELLEVKELSKARDRLEKATAESTEMVFDSAVTALAKGLDKVVNEGKDAIPEGEDTEKFLVSTYLYGKDNEFWDDMRANGVTRQRFFLYTLLGGAVALGGNLFGVTSGLLGAVAPEASRDLRVDLLFPIRGFKRFYSPEDGYEFMYPQTWVGDSGLALRRQRDLEDMRASPAAVARARQRRSSSAPEVAFGPQGGDGIENVSVVKSELMAGFSLKKTLGEPKEAAEKLLSTVIAPPDSGREWELLDAFEDSRAPGGLVYQFEYRVQGERIRKPMRNIGVVAARGSTLFTVTVLAPEESWRGGRGEKFRQTAKSFRLTF